MLPWDIQGKTIASLGENSLASTPYKGKTFSCFNCLHIIASLQKSYFIVKSNTHMLSIEDIHEESSSGASLHTRTIEELSKPLASDWIFLSICRRIHHPWEDLHLDVQCLIWRGNVAIFRCPSPDASSIALSFDIEGLGVDKLSRFKRCCTTKRGLSDSQTDKHSEQLASRRSTV